MAFLGGNTGIAPIYSIWHPRDMVRVQFRSKVLHFTRPGDRDVIVFGTRQFTQTPGKRGVPFQVQDTSHFSGYDQLDDNPYDIVKWKGYRDVHQPGLWFRCGDFGNGGRFGVRPLTKWTEQHFARVAMGIDGRSDLSCVDCQFQDTVLGVEVHHDYWCENRPLVAKGDEMGWGGRYVGGVATPLLPAGTYERWCGRLTMAFPDGRIRRAAFRFLLPEGFRYIEDLNFHTEFLGIDEAAPYTEITLRLWDFRYLWARDTTGARWTKLQDWRVGAHYDPVAGFGFRVVDKQIEVSNGGGLGYVQPGGVMNLR